MGVPTTVETGLAVAVGEEAVLFITVTVDCGICVLDWLEIVVITSFSGQNNITRIARIKTMIAMVGQWLLVNDQNDDACAVCGACVAGVACAATVGCVTAGVLGAVVATGDVGVEGVVCATPVLCAVVGAGAVVAIGALFTLVPFMAAVTVLLIATRVLAMPLSVDCTPCACAGVKVALVASDAFNCESVATKLLNVVSKALIWLAESPPVVADGADCTLTVGATLPTTGVTVKVGVADVPLSPTGTIPADCSRFTNVAFAT